MQTTLMSHRRAGVLLHITSLPSPHSHGDMSNYAFEFVDQLVNAGFSVWQILPLSPTHEDLSPYQSISAHAGNPNLINLEWLIKKEWLSEYYLESNNYLDNTLRIEYIHQAYENFKLTCDHIQQQDLQNFINENEYWLSAYALFMALRKEFSNLSWMKWPTKYRECDDQAINEFKVNHENEIQYIYFEQYVFFQQWQELKTYANEHGIYIVGDMPIFVSLDSADVWNNRSYFALNDNGFPKYVAGVPPDYFSEIGQKWGNPHYQWHNIEGENFSWWIDRLRTQAKLYDGVRIDHFRGFVQYWEIPADEDNAINGCWRDAPGEKLLSKLISSFPTMALIAEDLGTITPDVVHLREKLSIPGMIVLQFAFSGDQNNPYLPENHKENSLVYTATHDNDTTLSWYLNLPPDSKTYVDYCLGVEQITMPELLIKLAFDSVAKIAIIPMQDLLGLGGDCRMNTPGTTDSNWRWQLTYDQFRSEQIVNYKQMLEASNRFIQLDTVHTNQVM